MPKTDANSAARELHPTAATFSELQRMLGMIEDKLCDISNDSIDLVVALRGSNISQDRDEDEDMPGLRGDLHNTFNMARRIMGLVGDIHLRTSFATEALVDTDNYPEVDDEVVEEDAPAISLAEAHRRGRRAKAKREALKDARSGPLRR